MMSSYYDPPEDGPGCIAGPDWWVTTYQHNERDEEIIDSLGRLLAWVNVHDDPGAAHPFQATMDLAKEGYEVFIRYGYAWAMEEEGEWLFASSYEDAQGEIGDRHLQEIEDAQERAVDTAMEAKYDRD
jgi:hypothetical protein